jgi:DNA-binding MarR family transcriptional regulator
MTMARERLSRLQRDILAWLVAEDQRLSDTMAASHEDLVQALVARGFDKGNISTSLKGLASKGLATITRTPSGRAEAVDLTVEGRNRVAALAAILGAWGLWRLDQLRERDRQDEERQQQTERQLCQLRYEHQRDVMGAVVTVVERPPIFDAPEQERTLGLQLEDIRASRHIILYLVIYHERG